MSDQDSDKYFYFGCAVIHGIVLLVLVFFTGSDLLKTLSKNNCCNLSLIVGIFFGIAFSIILDMIRCLLSIQFKEKKDRWNIVSPDLLQTAELRKQKKILFTSDITILPKDSLFQCKQVEEVDFAGDSVYFMKSAFEGCVNLKKITLPNQQEKIPDSLFQRCKSLKNITIPASVQYIGKNAFEGCDELKINFIDTTNWYYSTDLKNVGNTDITGAKVTKLEEKDLSTFNKLKSGYCYKVSK